MTFTNDLTKVCRNGIPYHDCNLAKFGASKVNARNLALVYSLETVNRLATHFIGGEDLTSAISKTFSSTHRLQINEEIECNRYFDICVHHLVT